MEWEREGPLVSASGSAHLIGDRQRILTPSPGQTSASKTRMISSRAGIHGIAPARSPDRYCPVVDQLKSCEACLVGPHLAVANDPVPGKLESGDLKA